MSNVPFVVQTKKTTSFTNVVFLQFICFSAELLFFRLPAEQIGCR